EQTTVSPASPALSTIASPGGSPGSHLTDTALLSGGYFPTGTITFTLSDSGGATVDTETVLVNGNGTYRTPFGFTAATLGTYVWHATYSGSTNDNPATANPESVTVAPTADLAVAVTDGRTTVTPGLIDTSTITGTNNGPDTVNSLTLIDAIPVGLSSPIFTPSVGAYDVGPGVWSGLSLATGQSVSMTLSGAINPTATGTLTNTVAVSGTIDINPGNNAASDTDTVTVVISPNPSPPPATTANMILRRTDGLYAIYDIGNNAILAGYSIVQVGTDWQFAGLGRFQVGDTADMLLRNASTGGFQVYDIGSNNITNTAFLGNVGIDWRVMGFGNFSSRGETDMILRNFNTGGVEVYDIANNQITGAAFMGSVGLDWQFSGVGNFSGRGTSDLLLRNANTGGLEVYDIANNTITNAAFIGAVGLDWRFSGVGNFSGVAGETDLLLRNSATGALQVYDIANNQLTGTASIGAVGLEWQFAGVAAVHGAGTSD